MTYLAGAAGVVIESDIPLPGLCPAHGPPSWSVSRGAVNLDSRDVEWVQQWIGEDRRTWLASGRVEGGYVLRFTGAADVLVDVRARRIVWCRGRAPEPGRLAAIGALIGGQVIPRVLSLDGTPILHASAVGVDGSAIVLAGDSGAGKSTLAAALCAAGGELLADDFVALQGSRGEFFCAPTATCVNLAPASIDILGCASRPSRRIAADVLPAARPLRVIHLLDRNAGEGVLVERVRPQDAFIRLFRLSYRMDSKAPSIAAAEFARLGAVAAAVPVQSLRMPRGPHALDAAVAAVLRSGRAAAGG